MSPPPGPRPARRPAAVDARTAAWVRLQEGNRRWARGVGVAHAARGPGRRAELVAGQTPFAAVLGCADSRVPPEVVFDQGLGDLFVVRTAGHAVDDTVLGSLEYAVEVAGVDLVVVLGHDGCGAIAATVAALAGAPVPGRHLADVVARLAGDVAAACAAGLESGADLARWRSAATAEQLQRRSDTLRAAVFGARLGVVAAVYDLAGGLVRAVGPVTDLRAGGFDPLPHSGSRLTKPVTAPG